MKRLMLIGIGLLGLISYAQADETFFKEVPFQKVLQQGDYSYYVGSQVIQGELLYEPNDMYGYRFEFKVNNHELDKLPVLKADPSYARTSQFVLNNHSDMNAEETARAAVYLGIKKDLNDANFTRNNCAVTGPIMLQATTIGFFGPDQAENFADIEAVRVIESGPFRMGCEER